MRDRYLIILNRCNPIQRWLFEMFAIAPELTVKLNKLNMQISGHSLWGQYNECYGQRTNGRSLFLIECRFFVTPSAKFQRVIIVLSKLQRKRIRHILRIECVILSHSNRLICSLFVFPVSFRQITTPAKHFIFYGIRQPSLHFWLTAYSCTMRAKQSNHMQFQFYDGNNKKPYQQTVMWNVFHHRL